MTRQRQTRRLRIVVAILAAFIALALFAKLNDTDPVLAKLYEFIRDTSLLIATIAVAYFANLYQSRQQFLQSLREQWREIVGAKGALVFYCHRSEPSLEEYRKASAQLSECIDNMRIVYANVGETDDLIGFYPYEPLHDMRRAFETIDPTDGKPISADDHEHIRDEIQAAFTAIREHFLDEFEIEEPTYPIITSGMRRVRQMGASKAAQRLQKRQARRVKRTADR